MLSLQQYVNKVATKLQNGKKSGMFDATLKVRNEEGVMQTFSRLLQTAENYYCSDPTFSKDPAKATINFSKQHFATLQPGCPLGVSGATQRTMDAMDISIAGAVFSLIPYLAVERDMSASATSISYQDLVAEYAHGDIAQGETLLGTFTAPSTKINMAMPIETLDVTASGSGDTTVEFNTAIMPESVTILSNEGSGDKKVVGFDRNGKLYFDGVAGAGTVDYHSGTVTFTTVPEGNIQVAVNLDATSDETGRTILTVTPKYETTMLVATSQLLLFKDNALKNAYLNKLNIKLAGTGATVDYGAMAISKLVNLYITYINNLVVNGILGAWDGEVAATADISGYDVSDKASTKYDIIKNLIIELNQAQMDKTGRGITAILTSSRGVNKLSASPDFVKSADFNELNAMVGTYDGIPVIRHQLVTAQEGSNSKKAIFYGIYKDPAGSAAPIAFGEFLPVTTSEKVANYNNPTQVAQSMYSWCGVATIVPGLVSRAELTFLA